MSHFLCSYTSLFWSLAWKYLFWICSITSGCLVEFCINIKCMHEVNMNKIQNFLNHGQERSQMGKHWQHTSLPGYKVDKSAPSGTEVGRVSVTDEDPSQTHTYSLVSDAGGVFAISSQGVVTKATGAELDPQILYKVTVKVTDSGTPPQEVLYCCCVILKSCNDARKYNFNY